MKPTLFITLTLSAALALASPAAADPDEAPAPATESEEAAAAALPDSWTKGRPISMQYFRAQDKRGINVFETTKDPGVDFTGFKIDFGAAFTSQVQSLSHSNTALPNVIDGVNQNQLADIGFGFNNSTANLYLHAQLAPG